MSKRLWTSAMVALSVSLAWGCGSQERVSASLGLEGRWEWLSAFGGWLDDTTTTVAGSPTVLELGPNGRFRLDEAGVGVTEGTYTVGAEDTAVISGVPGPTLRLSAAPPLLLDSVFVLSVSGDTLKLLTRGNDNFDHTFVRVTGR